jgi:hypothetical protein
MIDILNYVKADPWFCAGVFVIACAGFSMIGEAWRGKHE